MQKILILGAKGTLGQELVKTFSKENEVLAWDREELDLLSPDAKVKVLAVEPKIIINATGYNAVDKAESDPLEKDLCYKINAEVPQMLAECAKELGATFVNYSTDYVFSGEKGGYREDEQPDPNTEYGKSKLAGENNLQAVGGQYYIIRPSRIFGKPGNSAMSKKSFVDIMVEKKNDIEIKVVNDEYGSPTYAPDLAQFTKKLIEEKLPFGIYHGTNSGMCSWYEWAKEIFNILCVNPKLTPISGQEFIRPAKRPVNSSLVNTKFSLQRSWQSALKEYLENKTS